MDISSLNCESYFNDCTIQEIWRNGHSVAWQIASAGNTLMLNCLINSDGRLLVSVQGTLNESISKGLYAFLARTEHANVKLNDERSFIGYGKDCVPVQD